MVRVALAVLVAAVATTTSRYMWKNAADLAREEQKVFHAPTWSVPVRRWSYKIGALAIGAIGLGVLAGLLVMLVR